MAADRFEIVRSIIYECPALKLPQTFMQQIGMTAQIVPLKGLTEEQAQAIVDRLNAHGVTGMDGAPSMLDALQQADAFLALLRGLFLSNAPQLATESDRRRLFEECVRIRTLIAATHGAEGLGEPSREELLGDAIRALIRGDITCSDDLPPERRPVGVSARRAFGAVTACTTTRRHVEQAIVAAQRMWDTPKAQQNTAIQLGEVIGHLQRALGVDLPDGAKNEDR